MRTQIERNPYKIENDFGVSYIGPPHPISEPVAELARGTFFTEWAIDMQPGPYQMEKEAVRMMASLLGRPQALGFITNGGTESNISAMRLARNLAKVPQPEMIVPETGHYSFRLGAELLGVQLHEAPIGDDFRPDMDWIESRVNANTIGLICSAPDGNFGLLDPIEEFADLAQRKGLFLHVDGAFGGFILPFMRALGREIPAFDFSLPGVSTFMTDGHKLGTMPVATGFFLVRDEEMLDAIPTERTVVHNLTATKNGERAATAWAIIKSMGFEGYVESVRRALDVVDFVTTGIERIEGLQMLVKSFITIVNFTSDVYDVRKIHEEMLARGWGHTYGESRGVERIRMSIHPHRDMQHAEGFMNALEDSLAAVRSGN